MMQIARAAVPGALLLAFAAGGGFFSGASVWVWALWFFLALVVAIFAPSPPARTLRLPMSVALVVIAVSCVSSDLWRAGSSGVALLPLLCLVPGLVPAAGETGRGVAVRVVLAATGLVAGWALVDAARESLATQSLQRAAMPIGHHNLLAFWLLPLLFVALGATGSKETTERRLAVAAAVLAGVAVASTGSFGGLVGCAVGLLALVGRRREPLGRSARAWLGLGGLALIALATPRALGMLRGLDVSTQVRQGYLRAAWDGFLERPLWGHGPGSGAWKLGFFHRPRLGVNPGGEIVTDAHSLPFDLLFELGLGGLVVLGVAAAWWLRRRAGDDPVDRGAWAGLAAWGAMSTVAGVFDVAALAMPFLVCVGLLTAREQSSTGWRVVLGLYFLVAMLWLQPFVRAQAAWDAARVEESAARLARATALDPSFPLYRALSPTVPESATPPTASVPMLLLGARADADQRRRACAIDPLSAWAPFLMARGERGLRAVALRARAVALQPELLAADELGESNRLLELRDHLEQDARLPVGWRAAFVDQIDRLVAVRPRDSPEIVLAQLRFDDRADTSVSLFAFRRLPWARTLEEIPLRADRLELVDLPPLSAVAPEVDPGFLDPRLCAAPVGAEVD